MNRFKVTELGSLGYGNPDAKIGFQKIVERNNIPPEVIKYAIELLKSGECMVKVKRSDDGLSFQFATAAELTDGTLENYLVEAA